VKRILLVTTALAALCAPALAADLPIVKAPMLGSFDPGGHGFYCGLGAEAGVEQANVSGSNLFVTGLASGSLTASGGAVVGACGYINGNALRWWRIEASAGYQNITGANAAVGSVASRWSATQEFDVGFEVFARIFSAIPSLSSTFAFPTFTPQLPANVLVAGAPRQYVGVGFREYGLSGAVATAEGSSWSAAPMLKTGYIWQTLDAAGKQTGGALDAYAYVAFPMRGITIGNVGATAGGPPIFTAGVKEGTQYGMGLKYDFSL
jgi:hypothetical protein